MISSRSDPFAVFRGLAVLPVLILFLSGCTTRLSAAVPTDSPQPPATADPTSTATATVTATTAPTETPTVEPSPTATPPWGCAESQGRMELSAFETELQSWPVDMRVYLPPCYDPTRNPGYPLLVILHGQTYTYEQWDRDGMDETADRLTAAGVIQPMIIAMPNESRTDRRPENSNFDEVTADAVLPWVEDHYNTCAERFCRAVGGLSRGAAWSVHVGFRWPELFGSIGAHSFTPFIGDVYRLKYWLMNTAIQDLPRFYLDMGREDKPEHIEAIHQYMAEMTRLGVAFEWHDNPGGHDDAYWSAHVEEYLVWYAQAWADLAWQ